MISRFNISLVFSMFIEIFEYLVILIFDIFDIIICLYKPKLQAKRRYCVEPL